MCVFPTLDELEHGCFNWLVRCFVDRGYFWTMWLRKVGHAFPKEFC